VPTERELSEILSSLLPFPALFSFVSLALVQSINRSISFPRLCVVALCCRVRGHHTLIIIMAARLISFYGEPPRGEITIHQFEAWAFDRLTGTAAVHACACVWERRGAVNVTLSVSMHESRRQ